MIRTSNPESSNNETQKPLSKQYKKLEASKYQNYMGEGQRNLGRG
jgi:hypothetical protein